MAIRDGFLPELDHEMATTRRLLARVPAGRAGWRPHPKSRTLGELAMHIAGLAGMGTRVLKTDDFEVSPPGGPARARAEFTTPSAMLLLFDQSLAECRAALAAADDATLLAPWTLKHGGTVVFTLPRAAALRTMMLNHLIHHRGQLTVYLRLNDVPLPGIYGPSADEA